MARGPSAAQSKEQNQQTTHCKVIVQTLIGKVKLLRLLEAERKELLSHRYKTKTKV